MRYTGRVDCDGDLVSRECVSRKYDLLVGDEAARAMIYVGDQSVSATSTKERYNGGRKYQIQVPASSHVAAYRWWK